jgi:hypothetical protein
VQSSESDAVRAVRRLWVSFEARAWEAAGAVLADTFVCEWPQTGERFRGRDNYLAMNRAHPAPDWHIAITRLVGDPTTAAAEVVVTSDNAVDICLAFYRVRAGLIEDAVEYWTEPGVKETPQWRAEFTERAVDTPRS